MGPRKAHSAKGHAAIKDWPDDLFSNCIMNFNFTVVLTTSLFNNFVFCFLSLHLLYHNNYFNL